MKNKVKYKKWDRIFVFGSGCPQFKELFLFFSKKKKKKKKRERSELGTGLQVTNYEIRMITVFFFFFKDKWQIRMIIVNTFITPFPFLFLSLKNPFRKISL